MKYVTILISLLFTILYSGTNWLGCKELIKEDTQIWFKKSKITNDYIVMYIMKGNKSPIEMYGDKYTFNGLNVSYRIIFSNEIEYFEKRNNGTLKAFYSTPMGGARINLWCDGWFDGTDYKPLKEEIKNAHKMIGQYLRLCKKYGKEYDILLKKPTLVHLDRWEDI